MEVDDRREDDRAARRSGRPNGVRGLSGHGRGHPGPAAIRTSDDEFSCTWGEYARAGRGARRAGSRALGVERGDTVALMLTNRPEFHFADSAVMHLGATPFSIYNTYTPEQIELPARRRRQPRRDHRAGVPGHAPGRAASARLARARRRGRRRARRRARSRSTSWPRGATAGFDFEAAWQAVEPDDVLTLIYTSGTTGPPKGVQITHAQHLRDGSLLRRADRLPRRRADRLLPADGARRGAQRQPLPADAAAASRSPAAPTPREVIAYLPEVKPTWFFAVPRIWEKLKAGLEQMLAAAPAEQRAAAERRWTAALEKVRLEQAGEAGARRARRGRRGGRRGDVLEALRRTSGSTSSRPATSGAAPTPPEVIEFFHALGIPLAELWGMSETTGAGTCNPPERIKIGTVGPPAPDVEIKLAEDGEVMIKGPVVMKGYRNLPEKTAETFTDDGFLLTGDIGEFDEDGYLQDRRPQEGADHHRRGQEPLAREHRGAAEAGSAGRARRSRSATGASTSARC